MTLADDIAAHMPRLRRYARVLARDASAADDLVQDTVCRALSKQHLFQPGTDLRAWLFTMLHNGNVNRVRQSVRRGIEVDIDDLAPVLPSRATQEARVLARDAARALAALPRAMREVILLIGVDGLSYDEAAEEIGVDVGTVRSRLSRGRDMLHGMLGER